jgi:CheY-like chemotaxis protein
MFESLASKIRAVTNAVVAALRPAGRRAGRTPPGLHGWRILLVEDHDLTADVIKAQLGLHLGPSHPAVRHVRNGKLALEAIESDPPDLVITDLLMPEMNGDDLIRALRARGYDMPVVGMTASPQSEMDRFCAAGATAAMPKPFCLDRLRDLLADRMPRPPAR